MFNAKYCGKQMTNIKTHNVNVQTTFLGNSTSGWSSSKQFTFTSTDKSTQNAYGISL